MPTQSTEREAFSRWPRVEIVRFTSRWSGLSETEVAACAEADGIPCSTAVDWVRRRARIDSPPEWVAFFESEAGLAWLRRFVVASIVVLVLVCGVGERRVGLLLRLCGLSAFVACSTGTMGALVDEVVSWVNLFAQEQVAQLRGPKGDLRIALLLDEIFRSRAILVAIEPRSRFIVCEKPVDRCDKAAWSAALCEGLRTVGASLEQATADGGSAIAAAVHELGVPLHGDLFHPQMEIGRGTSVALQSKVRAAEEHVVHAEAACLTLQNKNVDGAVVAQVQAERRTAAHLLQRAVEQRDGMRKAVTSLGQVLHPFDLHTKAIRWNWEVEMELRTGFGLARDIAEQAGLSERALRHIDKAERSVLSLVSSVAFFHLEVHRRLDERAFDAPRRALLLEHVLPWAYLQRVAQRTKPATIRAELRTRAEDWWREVEGHPVWQALADQERDEVRSLAVELASIFHRASSMVEGRNAQLSLHHHSLRGLPETRLRAMTAVHNFLLTDSQGRTAAERLFGKSHASLIDYVAEHLVDLPLPAAARSAA